MSFLNPQEAFDHLQSRVLEGIEGYFPNKEFKGRAQTLRLDGLETVDDLHPDDLRAQHKAKVEGESWAVPVYANLTLLDNESGKTLDHQRLRIAEIPKTTSRHSYIVAGRDGSKEYQVASQWQLKPGAYTRRSASGGLETYFNVTGKRAFHVTFDPASKVFRLEYNKAKPPIYPLLQTLGVSDDTLKAAWGAQIFDANKNAKDVNSALDRFYRTTTDNAPASKDQAAEHFYTTMQESKMRPEATAITLGRPHDHVNGDALTLATQKILKVQGGHPEDDRDNLVFKDLRATGDFALDKLNRARKDIRAKISRQVDSKSRIRDIVRFDMFNGPIKSTFHDNAAALAPSQTNPVEMVSSAMQTTIMGPGGVRSDRQVTNEAKFVNPSHLGFLDPIHTPEGEKTGVSLRLPIGVKKVGKEAKIPLYNLRSHHTEFVGPGTFMTSKVVLPDQVRWEGGVPKPVDAEVKMSTEDNEIRHGKFADADYVLRHPSQLFNMTSNLVPFLGNVSGGRASMAGRQIEQAISLAKRENPLVQVSTGVETPGAETFEKLMGAQASHQAPVAGTVTAVSNDAIVVRAPDGKSHEVQIYNNYPLNDAKGVYHSTPLVTVGQSVKKGQTVADTNFSKNGTLALGTNLRVAFIPFKGLNFEDGVVISETAADKLSSVHMNKPSMPLDESIVLNKKKFQQQHPSALNKDQAGKLDDHGVIRVGQTVHPGEVIVAAMKPFELKDKQGLSAIRKSMSGAHTDKSLRWDSEFDGEVVGVHRSKGGIQVHVRTVEPMQVGDKLTGRYGNKGIVSRILPDAEMPHTSDGNHIEVALNPSGVPGRMNVGQVLETAAAKIAKKTGKPYIVKNFEPNVDYLAQVKKDLKDHGISDTEELHDPVTKQPLGKALVGYQHILKLEHQVEKKLSVRSGMSLPSGPQEGYDRNLQPTSGGGQGGQSMGTLGLYALLAHGAKANIREMQSYKSQGPDKQTNPAKAWPSDHKEIWAQIQTNRQYPTPKPTFVFEKFTQLLRGAGVNLQKRGHDFVLTPFTDTQVKQLAKNVLPNPAGILHSKLDRNGDPMPIGGGLFDEHLTGGHGGRNWTRIALSEPLPNPIFEKPIQVLTGLNETEYFDVIHGNRGVTANGHLTDVTAGVTGGEAIDQLLKRINVKKELPKAEEALKTMKVGKGQHQGLDRALKKVKYLRALKDLDYEPSQAYVLHNLPVIPPVMRPVSTLPDGSLKFADLNQLYSDFAKINDKLKDPILKKNLTDAGKSDLRRDYYDGVRRLMGVGFPYDDVKHKGILHQISGGKPKDGFFQNVMVERRQDLTMRSTIVPEPALGLDEVGIPRNAALDLFRPFVVHELKQMGAIKTPGFGEYGPLLEKKPPVVWKALERVMAERPVLMKRDPALHKYSVQAFKARPVVGNAVQIHPLVTSGYNADFDGDTMSIYVPITREAIDEAKKMYPSNNLFSEATGKVMYQPTLESALGLYKLSRVGKDSGKKFFHPGEVIDAMKKGDVKMHDIVRLGSAKTTPGRVLIASAVPQPMQKHVLENLDYRLNRGGLDEMLTTIAKDHSPDFGAAVNRLKDLGNGTAFGAVALPRPTSAGHALSFRKLDQTPVATHDLSKQVFIPVGTHTLALDDFTPDKHVRDAVLGKYEPQVKKLYENTKLPRSEQDRQAIDLYTKASEEMKKLHMSEADKLDAEDKASNLFTMLKAQVKPGWDQYKQMVLAPMLLKDSADRTIPTPVTKSYAEGLDIGGYWTQMHGARRGSVMKVQEVRDPGYLSKQMVASMMHMLVNSHDCGTTKGVSLGIDEPDLIGRYMQQDFTHGKMHIPKDTMLTPDIIGKMRAAKETQVVVRSPLKCEEEKGLCQKCMGLGATGQHFPLGTNIGLQSAQTIGERAMQLTLKSFHTGGVQELGGSKLLSSFNRLQQLYTLPEKVPNAASLAMKSGKIEKIEPTATGVDIIIGGERHHVGKDTSGQPLHEDLTRARLSPDYVRWEPPQVGLHVQAGQHLSDPNRTILNLHDLYKATGSIEKVQNQMTNEISNLYKGEGVKRRIIETTVKAMSNLSEVTDPGDHPTVLRGEYRPTSVIFRMNEELKAAKQKPIDHKPVLKGVGVLPLEIQDDWMAKLQHNHLRDTLLEAASENGVSHLHGTHPIPGMAFGAEFGLTSKDSTTPGREYLKNVPAHHY